MQKVNMNTYGLDTSTLGITITEMQKLFCHKIQNISIIRFLCVFLLSQKAFCAIFYTCMPACYNEKVKSAVLPHFLFLQDGQEESEDCAGKFLGSRFLMKSLVV